MRSFAGQTPPQSVGFYGNPISKAPTPAIEQKAAEALLRDRPTIAMLFVMLLPLAAELSVNAPMAIPTNAAPKGTNMRPQRPR